MPAVELGALLGELGDWPSPVVPLSTAPLLLPEAVPHGEVLGAPLLLSGDPPLENVLLLFSVPGCGCIAGGGDCGPGALVVGAPEDVPPAPVVPLAPPDVPADPAAPPPAPPAPPAPPPPPPPPAAMAMLVPASSASVAKKGVDVDGRMTNSVLVC